MFLLHRDIFSSAVVNTANFLAQYFTFITSSKWATTFSGQANLLSEETKSEQSTHSNNIAQVESSEIRNKIFRNVSVDPGKPKFSITYVFI